MLISGNTGNRNTFEHTGRFAADLAGTDDLWRREAGIFKEREQFLIPLPSMDVEQHGARCVGDIGDVPRPARELPDQPTINVPKANSPRLACSFTPEMLSSIQRILLAEKYASITKPVFC